MGGLLFGREQVRRCAWGQLHAGAHESADQGVLGLGVVS